MIISDNYETKSEQGLETTEKNDFDKTTLETENYVNLITERRLTTNLRLTVRKIQAEICSKLVSVIFKKFDFMYIYSIKEEDNTWLDFYMKAIQNKDRFTIKYSTIDR